MAYGENGCLKLVTNSSYRSDLKGNWDDNHTGLEKLEDGLNKQNYYLL